VKKYVGDKVIARKIYVPGKILNIIISKWSQWSFILQRIEVPHNFFSFLFNVYDFYETEFVTKCTIQRAVV
jgi:hypothetical protein